MLKSALFIIALVVSLPALAAEHANNGVGDTNGASSAADSSNASDEGELNRMLGDCAA